MHNYYGGDQTQSRYVVPAQRSSAASTASSWRSVPSFTSVSQDTFVPQGRTGLVVAKSDVSVSHIRKADWIIQAFPEGLQNHFRNVGCQVKLAKTMDEIFPDLRQSDEFVTNMAHTRSWKQIRGCARGHVVGIPEYIQDPVTKKFVPQTTPSGGLNAERHEFGHVLHNTSSLLHDETEIQDGFWEAYTDDLNQMSYSQSKKFRYMIQTKDLSKLSPDGMKEAFAEVFAAIYGGGCRDGDAVMAAFPNTTHYIRESVKAAFPDTTHLVRDAARELVTKFAR